MRFEAEKMPMLLSAELQRGQLQLAALQKPAAEAIAAETKAIALFAIEALLTGLTKKAGDHNLNAQLGARGDRAGHHHRVREAQRLRFHPGQAADAQADRAQPPSD